MHYMGSRSLGEETTFGGCSVLWKHCKSLLQCTQQKLIKASTWLLQPNALLRLAVSHKLPPPKKKSPLWCGISSKFFDHLLLLLQYYQTKCCLYHTRPNAGVLLRHSPSTSPSVCTRLTTASQLHSVRCRKNMRLSHCRVIHWVKVLRPNRHKIGHSEMFFPANDMVL